MDDELKGLENLFEALNPYRDHEFLLVHRQQRPRYRTLCGRIIHSTPIQGVLTAALVSDSRTAPTCLECLAT